MAKLGYPFSFHLGGSVSPQRVAYDALKSAVGEGGSAPGEPNESIVEAWRFARARGLAASIDDDRAAAQINPETATDFIPVFEQILREFFPADANDTDRRERLTELYIDSLDVAYAPLLERLQAINPGASIIIQDRTLTRDTQFGRVHEDYDTADDLASGPPMDIVNGLSGTKTTSFPNFSSDFILVVETPPAVIGSVSQTDVLNIRLIEELLNRILPVWVDYRVYMACGFTLDQDPLDATVFCS